MDKEQSDSLRPSNTTNQYSLDNFQTNYENQFLQIDSKESRKIIPKTKTKKYIKANTYKKKIEEKFQAKDYDDKTIDVLKNQIKDMKKMLIDLDKLLTDKINRYPQIQKQAKQLITQNNPEKEKYILLAQIQENRRIMQMQNRQIINVDKQFNELEERDNLLELEERINKTMKQIQLKKKQKHEKGVIVDKLINKLMVMDSDKQCYRKLKILKVQLMFNFKKYHENLEILKKLEKSEQQYIEKQKLQNNRKQQLLKITEKSTQIMEKDEKTKKQYYKLHEKIEGLTKKLQISLRSKKMKEEKLEKEVWELERELNKLFLILNDTTIRNQTKTQQTDTLIEQQKVSLQKIRSLSYKFGQDNQSYFKILPKKTNKFLDTLKNSSTKNLNFSTIEEREAHPKVKYINDKNKQVIEINSNFSIKKEFRIKKKDRFKTENGAETLQLKNGDKNSPKKMKMMYSKKQFH